MDLPDQDTFCVAPWFQIRNENNFDKKVCCRISNETITQQDTMGHLNGDKNLQIKKNLHTGIKDPHCIKCWKDEANNIKSLRQSLTGVVLKNQQGIRNTWIDSYFRRKDDWLSDRVLFADVNIGNTCNFACVMCIPDDSSQIYNFWKKHSDSEFVQERLDVDPDYLDRIKRNGFANSDFHSYIDQLVNANSQLRQMSLQGGEPLLDARLLRKLSQMDEKTKSNMHLLIQTNGSVDMNQVVNMLGNFKRIHFNVSLEGTGPIQDYARYGSDWSKISKNILALQRNEKVSIQINHTIQVTTILGLADLINWCGTNKLPMSFGIVERPDYLGLDAIPDVVKNKVIEQFNYYDISIIQDSLSQYEMLDGKDLLNRIKNSRYNDTLNQKFKRYVEWYEKGRNLPKLKNLFPELYI